MASGTIAFDSTKNTIEGRITWSSTANVTANTSTLKYTVQLRRTNNYTTSGTWTGYILAYNYDGLSESDNYEFGDEVEIDKFYAVSSNWTTVATRTVTVPHMSNGECILNCRATIWGPDGTSLAGEELYIDDFDVFVLDTIRRKATITSAPDFNDDSNPIMKYTNPMGTAVTKLEACIASSDGLTIYVPYRDITKTGTSYTFSLTTAEKTTLRKSITSGTSKTVKFYIQTTIGSEVLRDSVSKTFSIINGTPTLSPTVIDTDSYTTQVTGDNSILVKYFSDAKITTGATARKDATIKSQSVVCGAQKLTSASGTMTDVENGTFVFTVTDNRGSTTTQTINKVAQGKYVDYRKLTCNITSKIPALTGEVNITIRGNYFTGSIGKTTNSLKLWVRHKQSGETEYSGWAPIDGTPTFSNGTYNLEVPYAIDEFDYTKEYTFQAQAVDAMMTVSSAEWTVRTVPVFDWGSNDFNFNVDVKLNGVNTLRVSEAGNTVLASEGPHGVFLRPNGTFSGTNEAVLYPDGKLIVAGLNLTGAARAMTTSYALETTPTAATNYTVNSVGNAILLGNNLRCSFNVTRSSAVSGNITNEKVLTLKIKHSGKIKAIYSDLITTGADGAVSTFYVNNSSNDGTYVTFDIVLAATAASNVYFSTFFTLPCLINLDNY
jgi:hypothetical protein